MTDPRRRLASTRFKITALATAAVTVVLVATALGVVRYQRHVLQDSLDEAVLLEVEDLGASPPTSPRLDGVIDDDGVAQIVVDGAVIASTDNLANQEPITAAPTGREQIGTVKSVLPGETAFRVASRRVTDAAGERIVIVGASVDDLDEATTALTRALAVAIPVVVALFAALVWVIVGRTLAGVGDAVRKQQQFVADASHELRTPLTRIRSEVEVDLAHPEAADHVAVLRSVLAESTELERLVDDLLILARAEMGASAAAMGPVDLDEIAWRQARDVQERTGVVVDTTEISAAQVRGDAGQLDRAVRNLLDNAARHASTSVAIAVVERNGSAEVTVADDGPGVRPGMETAIFERFTRTDDARSRGDGGAGLGLAITRDIVERHGGTITVDRGRRGGARFTIRLPLT